MRLRTKVIEVGDWDMTADVNKQVAHGISDYKKIRSVSGIIRDDIDSTYHLIGAIYTPTSLPEVWFVASGGNEMANINMRITGIGIFQNTSYNSTGFNRGWLTITYED